MCFKLDAMTLRYRYVGIMHACAKFLQAIGILFDKNLQHLVVLLIENLSNSRKSVFIKVAIIYIIIIS